MTKRHRRHYTAVEDSAILSTYDGTQASVQPLAIAWGRSPRAIACRARELGLLFRRSWEPEDDEYLREAVALRKPHRQMARELGRSPTTIPVRLHVLGLTGYQAWTPEEDAEIMTCRTGAEIEQFAVKYHRTPGACRARKTRLRKINHDSNEATQKPYPIGLVPRKSGGNDRDRVAS